MKQILKGHVLNFAQEDIQQMVPPDTINRIKLKDPNPMLRAYVVAHEGEADGFMHGTGRAIFRWVRDAVYKVGEALGFGTAAFYRHEGNDGTGRNAGREPIGEIIGKGFREIGGKLHAIAVVHVFPKFKQKPLESASIEANIEYSMQDGEVKVDTVEKITGLALSDVDRPAFPGATLLASMQAFQKQKTGRGFARQGVVHMSDQITLAEVKAFIRSGQFSPLDFFSMDQLMEVPKVKNTFEKAQRVETENKELETKLKDQQKEHETKLKAAQTQSVLVQAKTLFDQLATERKLSTQQINFAKKNLESFKSEAADPEALKNDLQKFVDGQIKGYDETLKVIGLKPEDHGGTGAKPSEETPEQKLEREKAAGGAGGAGAGDGATGKDMTDPKVNDLIPA